MEKNSSVTSGDDVSLFMREWRSYVDPLLPLGKLAALASDPQDPQLRQEMYRYLFSQFAAAYFGRVHADAEYPDFWPHINNALNALVPNPDFVYYMTPLDGRGIYRISGYRGTVRLVDFQIGAGTVLPLGGKEFGPTFADYDIDTLQFGEDGSFEVLLSNERPAGHDGNWWALHPEGTYLMIRQIMYDWLNEVDARLAIERLDRPAIRPRPRPARIEADLKQISAWAENMTKFPQQWLDGYRKKGWVNKVEVRDLANVGGLSKQMYIEGLFVLDEDEALIYETEIPTTSRYWNIMLCDMMWSTIDPLNRQTSLNGHTARLDADGKFRAVVAARDPGVPNWLDTAGYRVGEMNGRWRECNTAPVPKITKVKLANIRHHLPTDTPTVTAEQRDAAIRLRRKGLQMRRRW